MEEQKDYFKIGPTGFVRLVDIMGNDFSVVQAARVSFQQQSKPEDFDKDRTLARYLMRHEHWTPFEMVETKWHVRLPIFVARQWIRHRTASVNEASGRYSELKDDYFFPDMWRFQDEINKQGSVEQDIWSLEDRMKVDDLYLQTCDKSFETYKYLLDKGVGKEMARFTLPVSTMTEWYWKIDLRNLFNFLKLRIDGHAQKEIRDYAVAMENILKLKLPVCMEAFEDYILNSIKFSKQELALLKKIDVEGRPLPSLETLMNMWEAKWGKPNKLEVIEFEKKLKMLQLS